MNDMNWVIDGIIWIGVFVGYLWLCFLIKLRLLMLGMLAEWLVREWGGAFSTVGGPDGQFALG